MHNFQLADNKGNLHWVSRSIAVVPVPIFHCRGKMLVPLGKRSIRSSYGGLWSLPCGFLDWSESASDAVLRETFEELGIRLNKHNCDLKDQPDFVNSTINEYDGQVVTLRFIVNCRATELPALIPDKNEITEAVWLDVSDENWYKHGAQLAFDHAEIVKWALTKSY